MDNERSTHLDLFSGIGGFALAARWAGFRTIGFCEIDKFCQQVLTRNFGLPLYPDIRKLNGGDFAGVTLVTGGFPCQPFSHAGKRGGTKDDRNLWPEMLRVITEARPSWVLGENVTGIIGMELDSVLSDLETIGYSARPFVIPACGVDARHRRNRVWIVAYSNRRRCEQCDENIRGLPESNQISATTDDASKRLQRERASREQVTETHERTRLPMWSSSNGAVWEPEPNVGRVAHGVSGRVHRLKALGNAIVPQCAYPILKAIYETTSK